MISRSSEQVASCVLARCVTPRVAARAVAAIAVAAVLSSAAGAQQQITGTVHDSLSANAALSGAEVSLLGTAYGTTTDASGHFSFPSVAPGAYTVVVLHPRLDSLALTLERSVTVPATGALGPVQLATPSLATFQVARCGRPLRAHEAIKFGAVLTESGDPAAGAVVTTEWIEQLFRDRESEQRRRSVVAISDANGAYVACGVPRTPALRTEPGGLTIATGGVSVTARAGAARTARLEAVIGEAALAWHDVTLTASAERVVVRGRVVDSKGAGIANATVRRVDGDGDGAAAPSATTDATGHFTLSGVPRRSEQLLVRAVGFVPSSLEFAPTDGVYDVGNFELPPLAFKLAPVVVTGMRDPGSREEFEYRRKFGLGNFIDDEEIRKYPRLTATVVAALVPRVEVAGLGGQNRLLKLTRPFLCDPRFFIDGADMGKVLHWSEQEDFLGRAVRLEIYGGTQAPARYTDFSGCGAVVIWTR